MSAEGARDPGRDREFLWSGAALALASAAYLYPFVRILWRVGDEGSVVYGAQLVAEGAIPYRDFFVENFGPGSLYWLAAFFKLFGVTWFGARLALLATGVVITVLVYWMTRRIEDGRSAILPALLVLLSGIPLWTAANYHWDSNLFALLTVAAFFLWQDRQRDRFLILTGVLAGLTSCCLQQKGLLVFLGLLAAVPRICRRGTMRRSIAVLAAAYGATGVAILAFFYRAGAFRELIYDTVVWPLTTYHGINRVSYGHGFGEGWNYWGAVCRAILPPIPAAGLRIVLQIPVLILVALPLLVAALALITRFVPGGPGNIFGPRLLPYLTAGAGLWLSESHRPDVFHLIYGSPLLLIACLHAWNVCFRSAPGIRRGALSLAAISMLLWGGANMLPAAGAKALHTRRGTVYLLGPDDALDFLQQQIPPGGEAFVYPYYPMYYFVAGIRNPTRHSILLYSLHTHEQFQAAIDSLESKKVRYVLWDTAVEDRNMKIWFPAYQSPSESEHWMERYLESRYDVTAVKNGFRIMRRKDSIPANPD